MKQLFLTTIIILSLIFNTSCNDDDSETPVQSQEIPSEIKNYVTTNFPSSTITNATIENDDSHKYEITLSGGYKLKFNSANAIVDIEGTSKLPDSVIPAKILQYVTTNYPSNYIISWETDSTTQEVKLNNNVELVFNMSGDFIRIDT